MSTIPWEVQKRVPLIRRQERLQVVKKRKNKKVLGRSKQWVQRACYPNHLWSYDFLQDQTLDGRSNCCSLDNLPQSNAVEYNVANGAPTVKWHGG